MTANDKIDIRALTKHEIEQQRKLDAKYKDMTHCEALDGFYWWCKQGILFLQGLSVTLGMGFPLMLADRMPSVSALVFSLGFIFIVVLEAAKGWTMDEINRLRIINIPKVRKIPMKRFLFAAVVLFGLNVAIGFWSSPFIVEILVEPKGIESIAAIDSIYTAKKEAEKVRFDSLAKKFEATALQIATKHARPDSTIRTAGAKAHSKMIDRAATQSDSLTASLSILNREHSNKVEAAENRNAEIMKEHKAFCNSFSFWAAVGAAVIEFFLTLLAFWIADFDHKKRTENASRLELLDSQDAHITTSSDTKAKDSEKTAKDGKKWLETAEIGQQAFQNTDNLAYAKDSNGIQIKMGNDTQGTTKVCEFDGCQKPFVHNVHNQKFCSDSCRKKEHNFRKKFINAIKK